VLGPLVLDQSFIGKVFQHVLHLLLATGRAGLQLRGFIGSWFELGQRPCRTKAV
jgi:hypothetical protein